MGLADLGPFLDSLIIAPQPLLGLGGDTLTSRLDPVRRVGSARRGVRLVHGGQGREEEGKPSLDNVERFLDSHAWRQLLPLAIVLLLIHQLSTLLDFLFLSKFLVEERVEEIAALSDLLGKAMFNPPGGFKEGRGGEKGRMHADRGEKRRFSVTQKKRAQTPEMVTGPHLM